MNTKSQYIALIGALGLQMLIANHASAYICTGTGNDFTDPLCDADEISADLGMMFDDTLLAKDDDPLNPGPGPEGSTEFGTLDVTQPAGGSENEVRFTYEGTTPQVIVEKADGWYSVYNWDTQIMEGDGYYYFVREFGNFNCDTQGVNCNASTSHVSAYGASPVPVPAPALLFGSGLLGMVGIARRAKAA
jgi:hypothetical protein